MSAANIRPERAACPLCGKPAVPEHRPFCSRGCRDRDLLAWFGESYRTPAPPSDEEAAEFASDGLDSRRSPSL